MQLGAVSKSKAKGKIGGRLGGLLYVQSVGKGEQGDIREGAILPVRCRETLQDT